jgi:hypothetical protein
MADGKTSTHKDLAAFHTYEYGREQGEDIERAEWDSDEAGPSRTAYRYLIQAAHRRSIHSCNLVAVERIAAALAIADGHRWPACDGHVTPERAGEDLPVKFARRRQRYRHLARLVLAEVNKYYELAEDTEADRVGIITEARAQLDADRTLVSDADMPSTVRQGKGSK